MTKTLTQTLKNTWHTAYNSHIIRALLLLTTLTLLSLLIHPAAADGLQDITLPDPPEININITPWDPETSYYTRYWFDYQTGQFQPYAFLQSITLPFTDIFGYWFFCILWFIYLWGVWARERAIELTVVMMILTGSLWGLLLPPESYLYGLICMAMGITAVIFRLIKKGSG